MSSLYTVKWHAMQFYLCKPGGGFVQLGGGSGEYGMVHCNSHTCTIQNIVATPTYNMCSSN